MNRIALAVQRKDQEKTLMPHLASLPAPAGPPPIHTKYFEIYKRWPDMSQAALRQEDVPSLAT